MNKAGTYKGVWLSGDGDNAGTYTYADEITVAGEASSWTNTIRLYTTADQTENTSNDHAQSFYYLTRVYSNTVPQYSINGIVWAGDHQTHRLTTYYNRRVLNFDLTKEIVPEATTKATGKKACAVSSGEKVIYRITLQARDGLTGQIKLQGKDIKDLLPASLTGFRWTKGENIAVSYDFGTGEGAGMITGSQDDWKITVPDAQKPNQQAITWGDGFSISFGSQPVYIYVELTYPQGDAWDAYVDAYSSTGVVNTFQAMGMDDSVSHNLKMTGKGVLQKGVYNTAVVRLTNNFDVTTGYFISNKGTNSRNIYGTTGTHPFATQYYITIANEGKGRLYLEDVQDILPDGMTLKNLQSDPARYYYDFSRTVQTITTANSFPFAECTTSGKNFTAVRVQVAASTADLQDGRQKVTFTFTPGGSGTVKYDAESGKCYLESGQAIQFGYFCYSGSKTQSKDMAVNTAVMPYCDYNGGGIEVGTSRFAVKDSSQMEAVLPNDDTNPTINENAWAADCGFAVDSADETTKWLTSTVTQHLGKVEIGLSKTVYGSTKSPNTKPNAVGNEEEVCWSVLVENKGTTALEDYVISDEIQEPYRITSVYAYFGTTEAELKSGNTYAFLCSIRDYDKASDTFLVANQRLKVNGDPIKIQADTHGGTYRSHPVVEKDPSFYIAIVRDTVSGKLRVNVRLAGPTWAVQSGTYGLDECWLDVSGSVELFGSGEEIAAEIHRRFKEELGLTVSCGVASNKIFAKLGSDMKKPDATTVIPEEGFQELVWPLPVSDLWGVGRQTTKKLDSYCINTIGALAKTNLQFLQERFGVAGTQLWLYANGRDTSRVARYGYIAPIKSIGHGATTAKDMESDEEVWRTILDLTQEIGYKLKKNHLAARGIQINVRDKNFFSCQYQMKLEYITQSTLFLAQAAKLLFFKKHRFTTPLRSITVRAIDLVPEDTPQQLNLFAGYDKQDDIVRLESAVDRLRERFGNKIVVPASLMEKSCRPTLSTDFPKMPAPMYH